MRTIRATDQGERSPLTKTSLLEGRPFWIVDGEAYDFTDWMKTHPGGAIWFRWTAGRDISVIFHTYHRDPSRLRKILERYRIEGGERPNVLPKMGLPPFLLDPDFDAARDLPKYDFTGSTLLDDIRAEMRAKMPRRRLRRWSMANDGVNTALGVGHIGAMASLVLGGLSGPSIWLCVAALTLTRTALAGAGHYAIHRKKPHHGEALFDINYVGTCLIGMDGHVLLHHPYLETGADVKKTFFDGMLRLHPVLRITGYTLHKLGMLLTGMLVRGYEVNFLERSDERLRSEFWLMRVYLLAELAACVLSGQHLAWGVQFAASLWLNTFLVVASHDFEVERPSELPAELRRDWAAQQIARSHDLSIVGNRWIDSFLSAGLSPHRVHHVLPMQASAFANLISEPIVRQVCEAAGIEWRKPKRFFRDRLPTIVRNYLLSPPKRRDPAQRGFLGEIRELWEYVRDGFKGAGAV